MKKKDQEIVNDYLIDYDMFSVEEIVKIIGFMKLIEDTKRKKVSKQLLIEKYNEYRTILNNKTLEKQYMILNVPVFCKETITRTARSVLLRTPASNML